MTARRLSRLGWTAFRKQRQPCCSQRRTSRSVNRLSPYTEPTASRPIGLTLGVWINRCNVSTGSSTATPSSEENRQQLNGDCSTSPEWAAHLANRRIFAHAEKLPSTIYNMPRTATATLHSLFDESQRPIYAVDARRRVIYCN